MVNLITENEVSKRLNVSDAPLTFSRLELLLLDVTATPGLIGKHCATPMESTTSRLNTLNILHPKVLRVWERTGSQALENHRHRVFG